MTATTPTLGILGAGQLATMLTHAANRIGVDVHVFRPAASNDRVVADHVTTASLDDLEAIAAWAQTVDVVTVETENIPLDTLRAAQLIRPVHPAPEAVGLCQDRLVEKTFLSENDIGVAPYLPVDEDHDVASAWQSFAGPAVLKTRRFGYDGKGQRIVRSAEQAVEAWNDLDQLPCIIEALVPFDCEISVIAARSGDGQEAVFDPGRNAHRDGILRHTAVPSQLDPGTTANAIAIARRILESQKYVGVLAVEFFVVGESLLVNELAPRVHNSGHWTMEGCAVDQFEQHVRAVMGLPLGSTTRHADVDMRNIIGDDLNQLSELLAQPNQRVHLYGKRDTRPGRKMGHVNLIKPLT